MTGPFTHEPFVAGRGMYGWNYADAAVRHVEEHNCAKGCTVPTAKDIAEFGAGGCCSLLASLYTGEPIPEFEGTETHVICHVRQAPPVDLAASAPDTAADVVSTTTCEHRINGGPS